jgi:hypothetical protein
VTPLSRDAVSLSKSADAELNRLRSSLLVAGSPLQLGEEESRIPVLISPHPKGYDLCLPAGTLPTEQEFLNWVPVLLWIWIRIKL